MARQFTSSSHCTCDFLTHFDLQRIIQNEKITTIDVICEKLMHCLTDKQLRRIIQLGIERHFTESKDCKLIKSIYNEFSEYHQKVNIRNKTNNNQNRNKTHKIKRNKYCNETFAIRDLLCNIFNYLDYDTLRECSNVNLNWLFGSYNPSALYCFNTSMINKKYKKFLKFGALNFAKFKNCRKIVIAHWRLEQSARAVDIFDNVREIDINGSLKLAEYPHGDPISHKIQRIGLRVVKNNVNKIEKLRFIGCGTYHYKMGTNNGVFGYEFQISKHQLGMDDLYFPHLVQLSFKNMRLGVDINILDILGILEKNSNTLNRLEFESCVFSLDFWVKSFREQEIVGFDKETTSGLKYLKLNSVRFCMAYPSRYSGSTKNREIKGCVKETLDKMALLFSNVEELEWFGHGFCISHKYTGGHGDHIDSFYENRMDDIFSYFISQLLTNNCTIKKITFERFGSLFYMNDFLFSIKNIERDNNLNININNVEKNNPYILTIVKRKININDNYKQSTSSDGNDNDVGIDKVEDNVYTDTDENINNDINSTVDHEENNDEWGMDDGEFKDDDDDDGDWGSAEEIDVFDANTVTTKTPITLDVGDPLATSSRNAHGYGSSQDEYRTLTKVPHSKKLDVVYQCKQHGKEYLHQIKFQDSYTATQGFEYFCNGPGCNVSDAIAVQTHELGSNMSID